MMKRQICLRILDFWALHCILLGPDYHQRYQSVQRKISIPSVCTITQVPKFYKLRDMARVLLSELLSQQTHLIVTPSLCISACVCVCFCANTHTRECVRVCPRMLVRVCVCVRHVFHTFPPTRSSHKRPQNKNRSWTAPETQVH